MDVSETIKSLRQDAGLTQQELAEKSGVSYSYLTKLESGAQTNPTINVLESIKKAALDHKKQQELSDYDQKKRPA